LVLINAAQNKAVTYGRNKVLPFDRLNARQVADGGNLIAERLIER
jgi:hypothetical protein